VFAPFELGDMKCRGLVAFLAFHVGDLGKSESGISMQSRAANG